MRGGENVGAKSRECCGASVGVMLQNILQKVLGRVV